MKELYTFQKNPCREIFCMGKNPCRESEKKTLRFTAGILTFVVEHLIDHYRL